MNYRTYLSFILAFTSVSLFAQPKITSINYVSQDVATLTRNAPPTDVTYYWQGTSCGTSTASDASTYTATASGVYYLRAFFGSAATTWGSACASTTVTMPDMTAPVLSDVTAGPIEPGDNISATSNEDGMVYMVPEGTTADLSSIIAAKVAEAVTVANVASTIPTSLAISLATYVVYAVDASDNVSVASPVISVEDLTAPVLSDVTPGPVEIGDDISATSDEDGMIFLVPNGTAPNIGDINTAKVAEAATSAGVAASLSTTGLSAGSYIVYAIDGSDNISSASAAISVNDPGADVLNTLTSDDVQLYPAYVDDILTIKSEIQVISAVVYNLQGSQVININTPTESINMSELNKGIYIVSIELVNNEIFTGKVIKK